MDKLSKEDALQLDNFTLLGQNLDLQCEAINARCAQFRAQRAAHAEEMRVKYSILEGDTINTATGEITRAARPEAPAPAQEAPDTSAEESAFWASPAKKKFAKKSKLAPV